LTDTVVQHVRRDRLLAWLSAAFGAVALVLAAVGLYGVISYAAQLRTQEMGIRLALGALPRHVCGLLLGEVARLFGAGLAIGIAMTLLLTRSLQSLLFELLPQDPATLAVAAGLLAAVAVTAGYLPARRAGKLDPMVALRPE
jgi:ABC-type antimicrobial peptide transport system permease subunit